MSVSGLRFEAASLFDSITAFSVRSMLMRATLLLSMYFGIDVYYTMLTLSSATGTNRLLYDVRSCILGLALLSQPHLLASIVSRIS